MQKSDKNKFRILNKAHAYLQTILKASVKIQKDRPKTVGGGGGGGGGGFEDRVHTPYILLWY